MKHEYPEKFSAVHFGLLTNSNWRNMLFCNSYWCGYSPWDAFPCECIFECARVRVFVFLCVCVRMCMCKCAYMYVFEEKSRRRIIPAPSWREPAHLISLKAFHCCRLSHHLISTANNIWYYQKFKSEKICIFRSRYWQKLPRFKKCSLLGP